MKMEPTLIDEVNYVWKASGNVVAVYVRNELGEDLPIEFIKDPEDNTVFRLPHTPYGEVTCDVD